MSVNITFDMGQVLFGLAALATSVFPILSWLKSRKNSKDIAEVNAKADRLHDQGNSNLEKMNKMAEEIGNAKGRVEEKAEQKAAAEEHPNGTLDTIPSRPVT